MEVTFPRVHGALCSSGGVIVSNVQDTRKTQVINATMLRTKTRDILEQAKFQGEHFIVETFGKPMVDEPGSPGRTVGNRRVRLDDSG